MRKNHVRVSAIMAAMVLMLTGCGGSYPDITQEEEQLVGEYAAKLLLKYDANNRGRLLSREDAGVEEPEIMEETEEPEVSEPIQEETEQVEDTPVIENVQLPEAELIGSPEEFYEVAEGIIINYHGVEVCDTYPQDEEMGEYFALDAAEGKRLLVLKFAIENHAQTDQNVDLLSQDAIIRIIANGSYSRNVLTTMLMDDMSTYRGDIPAGEAVDLVLLAEVDSDVADNISTLMLNLKNESKSCTIQLK